MTSVLLVDDHVLFRKRLREIFSGEPDLTVVGEACDGGTAVALAVQHRPDVVLLDTDIPGEDPMDTMTGLLAASPSTGVVIMSRYGETELVRELRAAGPRTWLLRTITRDDLVAAVHEVRAHVGRAMVPLPRVHPAPGTEADAGEADASEVDAGKADASEVDAGKADAGKVDAGETGGSGANGNAADGSEANGNRTKSSDAKTGGGETAGSGSTGSSGTATSATSNGGGHKPLSERELEIVRLAAGTLTKPQIAERLAISEATVKRHVRSIVAKLGVASLADAVDKAIVLHLIAPLEPSAT
jgi:DNA-binding NarL/FixJ family response regulator